MPLLFVLCHHVIIVGVGVVLLLPQFIGFNLVAWFAAHDILLQRTHHPSMCFVYLTLVVGLSFVGGILDITWTAFALSFGPQLHITSSPAVFVFFD